MPLVLSHQILQDVLRKHGIKPNDLSGIDKLFGGVDGYYWYHTMRHMCAPTEVIEWQTAQDMQSALQDHENQTAEEDEVKPQVLKDSHVSAIASLLTIRA
jgi:hypothetical protein